MKLKSQDPLNHWILSQMDAVVSVLQSYNYCLRNIIRHLPKHMRIALLKLISSRCIITSFVAIGMTGKGLHSDLPRTSLFQCKRVLSFWRMPIFWPCHSYEDHLERKDWFPSNACIRQINWLLFTCWCCDRIRKNESCSWCSYSKKWWRVMCPCRVWSKGKITRRQSQHFGRRCEWFDKWQYCEPCFSYSSRWHIWKHRGISRANPGNRWNGSDSFPSFHPIVCQTLPDIHLFMKN